MIALKPEVIQTRSETDAAIPGLSEISRPIAHG
jgi:hypothetical protein